MALEPCAGRSPAARGDTPHTARLSRAGRPRETPVIERHERLTLARVGREPIRGSGVRKQPPAPVEATSRARFDGRHLIAAPRRH